MVRSQLDFTGSHISSAPSYVEAVRQIRSLLIPGTAGSYVRPAARVSRASGSSAGTPLVLPPELRLVSESEDKAAHHALAAALPFPWVPPGASAPADLRAAVAFAVRRRTTISAWRHDQSAAIAQVALSLEHVNACVTQLARGMTHEHLLRGCNVAFIAAWCDAHQWPDVEFTQRFVLGFPVVGDIPDSHLFRPCYRPAVARPDTFSPDNNRKWTDDVIRRVAGLALPGGATSLRSVMSAYGSWIESSQQP
ncbi:hypothetical protein AB1Y20_012134 [Prymnesium parvum]|uniref:Uncharacterized protein n=1 Tax=Prymnesium parvum TaxID=97485 RepID=A0AB34IMP3_PRYPA